jgi:ATP-dependent RNA helicase DeaD
VVRLFVSIGSSAKLRPADLVGAIVNEAHVPAAQVGAIEITERHSTVEVPAELADEVIAALEQTTVRGRKVSVQRDRAGPRVPGPRSR